MKILGEALSGWIVEMTDQDLHKLIGTFTKKPGEQRQTVRPGATVDIDLIFSRAVAIESAPAEVAKVVTTLRLAADMLEKPLPIINPPPSND